MLVRLLFAFCSLILVKSTARAHDFVLPEGIAIPEGVTSEMVQEAFQTVLENILRTKFGAVADDGESRRNLQQYECDTLLAVISALDFIGEASEYVAGNAELDPTLTPLLRIALIGVVQNDFQVWKVCAKCSDYEEGEVACRKNDYGFDVLHSGILLVPYSIFEERILPGTRPVNIVMPSSGFAPSKFFSRPLSINRGNLFTVIAGLMTSTSASYSLLPDTSGFGESQELFRQFCVSQTVATATAPLIQKAESMILQESGCASAMADAYTVFGYSEGGYGAVVVADMLYRMKKTIISVHTGGGPYRLSSAQLKFAFDLFSSDVQGHRILATHLAAAYSSTGTDPSNFGMDQDLANPAYRDNFVAFANLEGWYAAEGAMSPETPFFDYFNENLASLFLDNPDDPEPCIKASNLTGTDKICGALIENDVVGILEKADYPVYLCHTVEDELVPLENLPDLSKNKNLVLTTVEGEHVPAAFRCIFYEWIYFWTDNANVQDFPVTDKTKGDGCPKSSPKEKTCEFYFFGICWDY